MKPKIGLSRLVGVLLILILVLAACGGSGNNDDSSSTADARPTASPFPTYAFVESTNPPVFDQEADSTEEATEEANAESENTVVLDPKLVGRGLGRYEALGCAVCHGIDGVGTEGFSAVNNLSLSQEEFVTFMRSGGDIGNSHQYSTDRLSKNGAANLYQYLISLAQGE